MSKRSIFWQFIYYAYILHNETSAESNLLSTRDLVHVSLYYRQQNVLHKILTLKILRGILSCLNLKNSNDGHWNQGPGGHLTSTFSKGSTPKIVCKGLLLPLFTLSAVPALQLTLQLMKCKRLQMSYCVQITPSHVPPLTNNSSSIWKAAKKDRLWNPTYHWHGVKEHD